MQARREAQSKRLVNKVWGNFANLIAGTTWCRGYRDGLASEGSAVQGLLRAALFGGRVLTAKWKDGDGG